MLAASLLLIWRCTQRRFSDLDAADEAIKWPSLQHQGESVEPGLSTLNPQGTRRTGGAGFAMEKDREEDERSEWKEGGGGGYGGNEGEYYEQTAYESSYAGQAGVGGGQRGSYCTTFFLTSLLLVDPHLTLLRLADDPYVSRSNPADSSSAYLGQSAAPYPPPPTVYPPTPSSPYLHSPLHSPQLVYGVQGGGSTEDMLPRGEYRGQGSPGLRY